MELVGGATVKLLRARKEKALNEKRVMFMQSPRVNCYIGSM